MPRHGNVMNRPYPPDYVGPKFCWHCGKGLLPVNDVVVYAVVESPDGNQHRVHKQCVANAVKDGNRVLAR